MTKLQEVVARGIREIGRDHNAVVAFAMAQLDADPELKREMFERAATVLAEEVVQELMDEGFGGGDANLVSREAIRRLRRRHLRVVS